MKIFWLVALALLRPVYFVYSLCCLLGPVFILYLFVCLLLPKLPSSEFLLRQCAPCILYVIGAGAAVIPLLVFNRKSKDDPNPFQSAFMSWFGTLRWYWNTMPGPMAKVGLPSGYLVENPRNYRLNATDMRAILNRLQPGDILLRAYDGYMDGNFIRHSSVCSETGFRQGWFTHAALYAGELGAAERTHVPAAFRHDQKYFQEGSQMVLHSMAMGVHAEDILTWFRCDYLAVLRVPPSLKSTRAVAPTRADDIQPNESDIVSQRIQNDLRNGIQVNINEVLQNAKLSALEKIGEPYDFECVQTDKFNRFSCAEFVYYCYRSIHDALNLSPQLHAFYPFGKLSRHVALMGRITITPDDYFNLARQQHLEIIWIDERSKHIA